MLIEKPLAQELQPVHHSLFVVMLAVWAVVAAELLYATFA